MSGAESIRFGGKIFGTGSDYWIAYGRLSTSEEDSKDKTLEPRGTGVNETVFWVTDNLLNDWVQLPDCRPQDLITARKIKHLFTGNLNADVESNPSFVGKERHLLRAQLARIFHATAIVPAGMFAEDEETKEVKLSDEFTFPKTEELKDTEKWSNVHQQILFAGRVAHLEPTEFGEEGLEGAIEKLNTDDPQVERFRPINAHTPISGIGENALPSWVSKVVGDG